jgi:hypothetical protein
MATRTTVALEDDLDGGPAQETVMFGLGAAEYEIDLNASNATRFRRQLAPFIGHARKVGRGQGTAAGRPAVARQYSAGIRVWAKEHGIEIGERGRIPAAVIEQYEAAAQQAR